MTNVLLFIVVFLLLVIIGGLSTLIEKLKGLSDWIQDAKFEDETQLNDRQLQELENTEFSYGHNVKHTENDEG